MNFISYIEMPNKEIRFLTKRMIYQTEEGRQLQKYVRAVGALIRCFDHWQDHGAILYYYGMGSRNAAQHLEVTDFTSPDKMPAVIAEALRNNELDTTGVPVPDGLLMENVVYDSPEEGWLKWEVKENRALAWR